MDKKELTTIIEKWSSWHKNSVCMNGLVEDILDFEKQERNKAWRQVCEHSTGIYNLKLCQECEFRPKEKQNEK